MEKFKKSLMLFFILVFLLNLFWEVFHSLLYEWNPRMEEYVPRIIYASFGDLLLIFFIYIIVCLKNSGFNWLKKPSRTDCLIFGTIGILFAVFIELRAFTEGRWSYNYFMPTIFGIGISPLIQLALTSLFALWLVKD